MKHFEDNTEFEHDKNDLTQKFRAAQDLFDRAIKDKNVDKTLLELAIQQFIACETQLNHIEQKYADVQWDFETYIKDSFLQNFRHVLYFALADIHKYKSSTPFDLIKMYMQKSKSTGICDHAVPTSPLYTPERKFAIKAAIQSVKSNKQNPQYMIDFMCAHLYHHGLGNHKANFTVAMTLYNRAIKSCSETNNEEARNLLSCFYLNAGLLHVINPQNSVDFDKAAENFTLAIQNSTKEHTKFGFIALMELFFLINGKAVKNTLSQFDILLFKNELEIFSNSQTISGILTTMLVELSKTLLYDPRKEAFDVGQRLMKILAEKTKNSFAILAYANSLLHGIISSQISAPPPNKVNIYKGLQQSLEWHSKCEATENKYCHFNIGCILFHTDRLFIENKLSKKQVIALYNAKNLKSITIEIDDLELRRKLLSHAIYRMKLALPDPTGAVSLVLASAYLTLSAQALEEKNLRDHLKYYRLHLQTRAESFDIDIQTMVRNQNVARKVEEIQELWQSEDGDEALIDRQKEIRAIQIEINSEIIQASKSPDKTPSRVICDLLKRFLSADYNKATDAINISTLTTIIGRLFAQNNFDSTLYSENSEYLNKLFDVILQNSCSFTHREYHNIFCGLSRLRISSKHKFYTKCVNAMLAGLLSSADTERTLPSSLAMTPYLCDLFHSISRLEMPNSSVIENLKFILAFAQKAFQSCDPEEVINMLYPLAKLHTSLVNSKELNAAETLNDLLNTEIEKLSVSLPSHPIFERHESAHQWYLLLQARRQFKKAPEEKDAILQKFKTFFDEYFQKFPINRNTTESNLQKKFTSLIIKTLKPGLKNAKFYKEFVINGLPVDLVIKIPKIRNKRPSLFIPIQIHGYGHFFHESGEDLRLNSKEHFHQVIIGNPVIVTYQDFENLQGKSQEEIFDFLQQKLLPHFSVSPMDSKDKSDLVNVWQLVN